MLAVFTLAQILNYPFPSAPVRDPKGTAIAYTLDTQGVRAIWFARAPDFTPKELFSSGGDDGQELSNLVISSDDAHVVYVRGGDHDENWPQPLEPNPASSTVQPQEQVWSVATSGGAPKLLGDGDAPAISPDGARVAFTNGGAVMIAPIDGSIAAKGLFFDRGQDSELQWSPDGSALAFTSDRKDHSFVGIYRNGATTLEFLAPTTSQDFMPRWAPDGGAVAFIRTPGDGGPPRNPLNWNSQPWQIWVVQPDSPYARRLWASGNGSRDSLPQSAGGPFLDWAGWGGGGSIVFKSDLDDWTHLYLVNLDGFVHSLTPGPYMVEDVSVAPDGESIIYSANTGSTPGDDDRRHIYRVDARNFGRADLTAGASSETGPVALAADAVGFNRATAQQPPIVTLLRNGVLEQLSRLPAAFSTSQPPTSSSHPHYIVRNVFISQPPEPQLVTPQEVSFHAADGMKVYGQLFTPPGAGKHPAVIFVHGGPFRQMLLTWHYMDYYSNAYAVNQYLASRGFVVLSVNYRCGIGYGHDFNFPARWGPTGASEYQDVVAGARFLQRNALVDRNRIGIWGGSYGGYLTALALARNSDIFKAGVDFHGVHDWSLDVDNPVWGFTQLKRYQRYDTKAIMKLAWESSPDSAIGTWKSPVLLIQGDDDRNVEFHQMVDLVERLRLAHVPFEQIVIPNEIHGFLRYASWLEADTATVDYFRRQLGVTF